MYSVVITCMESNIDMIEAMQRKATRFVCNNYSGMSSVATMSQQLNWPLLERRRWAPNAIMMI